MAAQVAPWHVAVGLAATVLLAVTSAQAAPTASAGEATAATASGAEQPPRDRHQRGKHEHEKGRVILPSAAQHIDAALQGIRDVAPSFDLSISRDRAAGKVCDGKRCWPMTLTDPESECPGAALDAFCLTWTAGVPPATLSVRVTHALAELDPGDIWKNPPGRPWSPHVQLTIALLLVLVPLALGFVLGRGLRALLPSHPGFRSLLALAAAVGLAIVAVRWSLQDQPHPAPGEGVVTGVLLFCGAWLGGLKFDDPKALRVAIVATLVGLVATELALRQSVPEPPECWHGKEIKLLLPPSSERKCRGAFADASKEFFAHARRRASGRGPEVVHIGDSMVFGSGVGEHETFVAHLDRRDKGTPHVNISSPDTGPDHYLLTLFNWLRDHKPRRVVVYLYPGNDYMDLDRPDCCCGGASLLQYSDGTATRRCESPNWQPDPLDALVRSPPPFSLQVSARHTYLGAMACGAVRPTAAVVGESLGLVGKNRDGKADTDAHLTAVLKAFKRAAEAAGARLDVVVLPERDGLEAPSPLSSAARKRSNRALAAAAKAGVPALDAWRMVTELLRARGAGDVFAKTHPRDFHYSRATHAALATWLADKLGLGPRPEGS